jgi:beta-lactam-binding protein with PASTA domain
MQGVQVASQSTSTMVLPPPMAGTQVMGQVPGAPTRVQQPVGPATYAGQGGYDDLPPVRYDETTQAGRTAAVSDDDLPGKKAQKAALWLLLAIVVVGVFSGLAVLLTSGGGGDDDDPAAALVTIESVEGLSQDEATKILQDQGLTVEPKEQASDTVAKGKVINTDPPAGQKVEKGSKVTLLVSIGKEKVTVPGNLIGRPYQEVQQELQTLGFLVEIRQRESASARPDTVLEVKPGSGSQVNKGAKITLFVAKEVQQVAVPDVTGLDRVAAEARLSDAGFNTRKIKFVEEVNAEAAPGTVLRTNPAAGTQVPVTTTIVVYLAVQPELPPDQTTPPGPGDPNQPEQPGVPPGENDGTNPFGP